MYALNDCQMELSYKKNAVKNSCKWVFFNDEELISCLDLGLRLVYAIYTNLYNKIFSNINTS